jgi:hypothetical protein
MNGLFSFTTLPSLSLILLLLIFPNLLTRVPEPHADRGTLGGREIVFHLLPKHGVIQGEFIDLARTRPLLGLCQVAIVSTQTQPGIEGGRFMKFSQFLDPPLLGLIFLIHDRLIWVSLFLVSLFVNARRSSTHNQICS